MLTFEEVCERLKLLDELTLLEILEVTSEDLVEKYKDEIEWHIDYFYEQVKETESSGEGFED